jgi:quercetin dioxygenase-like cupin family protein
MATRKTSKTKAKAKRSVKAKTTVKAKATKPKAKIKARAPHVLRGGDKKEAFFEKVEAGIHHFKFERPGIGFQTEKKKIHVKLAGTNSCRAQVQILAEGGENNLHYHPHMDIIYMVLKGKVRFYGLNDKLYGEYGELQGLCLPANSRYWFESVGDEELYLLQIAGFPNGEKYGRVDVTPPKQADGGRSVWFDTETGKTRLDMIPKEAAE